MKVFQYSTLLALALFACTTIAARENKADKKRNKNTGVTAKAANCPPAATLTELNFNNVRTAVSTSGNTWYNRGDGTPYYNVPKGGEAHALYDGSLWMGGIDPAGNLKLAAVTFNQNGHDFWPGPLSHDGTATIVPKICSNFDHHYPISRAMVQTHRLYFTLLAQGKDPSENPLFENGYTIPDEILNWPGRGRTADGQAYNLAPYHNFTDTTGQIVGGEFLYEPELGDYPEYDLDKEIDCRTRKVTDPVPLFGDYTLWWVVNDKGNVHTESGGEPIGMEIRSQAFAFATNDEINNMTFYNYTLINRGSLTLTNTYFGQWVDSDLGCAGDDYVGCDVGRGLGYSYNGDNDDSNCENGAAGYGTQPPAIGIDFFEGPYQDADGINNLYGIGEGQALNGLGYKNPEDLHPDSIVDNERYGMRRFLYFNNSGEGGPPATTDPDNATGYYNFLRAIWTDGNPMVFGGIGYNPNGEGLQADFMFPGESDPLHWGTHGVDPNYTEEGGWTEENAGNQPGDRRLLESAGPFTLDPGEFNNITVGAVYARAASGGPFASVKVLRLADDKAQSLFENCFRLLEGPQAPDLTAQELDKKIILYLNNDNPLSNNQNEGYTELDPTIPEVDTSGAEYTIAERSYQFEGYQVYQLSEKDVSVGDIGDPEKTRLVYQGDIKNTDDNGNEIGQLVNYQFDSKIELPVPTLQVDGANEGIQHSIEVTTDLFAQENTNLVNYKKYYYLAIAYGYNNYKPYNPELRTGQSKPYLASRSAASGAAVTPITVIPHDPTAESGGTVAYSSYGDKLPVSRIEGAGNGDNDLELTAATENKIMDGKPWKADTLDYTQGNGPLDVKVVDPLRLKEAKFELKFRPARDENGDVIEDVDQAHWELTNLSDPDAAVIRSDTSIQMKNEQLVPEYGISIEISQYEYETTGADGAGDEAALPISSELTFPNGNAWLTGTSDIDLNQLQNWIKAGTNIKPEFEDCPAPGYAGPDGCHYALQGTPNQFNLDPCLFYDFMGLDPDENYEDLIGGIVAPYPLTLKYGCGPAPRNEETSATKGEKDLTLLHSVELVFTPDKSKWTRCPVLELQGQPDLAQGGAEKQRMRNALSVDKNGRNQDDPNVNVDEATFNGQQTGEDGKSRGMGWFPGYAINVETGERLNIAFGEDSYFASDNGRDMLWNPTSRITDNFNTSYVFGGQHYVYVFRNSARVEEDEDLMPLYDGGQHLYENLEAGIIDRKNVWDAASWVLNPLLAPESSYRSVEDGLVPGEARVKIRVSKPYVRYATAANELGEDSNPFVPVDEQLDLSANDWYPMYQFSTKGSSTVVQNKPTAVDYLKEITVVPNPYYAYSSYETGRLDNRVKFINLPQQCTIKIFNLNGDLIRTLEKDNPVTYLDWDLKNEKRIPIAGGIYICHIEAPGLGEHIVKFFASMRPQDLSNF